MNIHFVNDGYSCQKQDAYAYNSLNDLVIKAKLVYVDALLSIDYFFMENMIENTEVFSRYHRINLFLFVRCVQNFRKTAKNLLAVILFPSMEK